MAADTTTSRAPDARFLAGHPAHFIALGFGAGLAPKAPGTFGTLVAFPIYWALATVLHPLAIAFVDPALLRGRVGVRSHRPRSRRGRPRLDGVGRDRRLPAAVGDLLAGLAPAALRLRALPRLRHLEALSHSRARETREGRARRDDRRRGGRLLRVCRLRRRHHRRVQDPRSGSVKDWPYPRIFAHRGGGSLAPENTLAAIRTGQALGFRAHEFDVKLARDGISMLLHDDTLET